MINSPDAAEISFDTAFVFTGQSDYMELPQAFEFKADFGDRLVTLNWNAFVHDKIYTGYYIERSADKGKTYNKVNDEPIVFMYSETAINPEYMYRLDSLPENDKIYTYRIRGKTSFGELGPWSEPISGKGTDPYIMGPHNSRQKWSDAKVVQEEIARLSENTSTQNEIG